jgi:molecular chaperone IbpA
MRTTTFDFAPLWRSTIGFDRLFDLADAAQRIPEEDHYPLRYRAARRRSLPDISAVAGFSPDDIAITAEQNVLTIEGPQSGQGQHQYVYHGISGRYLKRRFSLVDYVQVTRADSKTACFASIWSGKFRKR